MAKSNIKICLGSSCFARGNNVNLEFIQKYLKENQQEADIIFSGHLCENKCGAGPVMSINEHVYEEVNLSRLQKILQEEFTQQ